MKATKLVENINELVTLYGDLEVDIYSDDSEQSEKIGGISVSTEDGPELPVISFSICGVNTQDAFMENIED